MQMFFSFGMVVLVRVKKIQVSKCVHREAAKKPPALMETVRTALFVERDGQWREWRSRVL